MVHFWVIALLIVSGSCRPAPDAPIAMSRPPCLPVPVDPAALQVWLKRECYQEWTHDAKVQRSTMRPGGQRVFLSPDLAASVADGATAHPVGAAAVREMYADDLTTRSGWSVSIKVSQGGADGWFWFEVFGTTPHRQPAVASRAARGCIGCHSHGRDFVQTEASSR